MAVNSVNFGEAQAQQQQKSSGSGIGVPIATTVLGGGLGYLLKAQPSQDEFTKRVQDGTEIKYKEALTPEEQAKVDKLKNTPKEEKAPEAGATKEAPKAAPEPATASVSADAKAKLTADKVKAEAEYIFGPSGAETDAKKILVGKTPERFENEVIKPAQTKAEESGKAVVNAQNKIATNNTKLENAQDILKVQEKLAENAKVGQTGAEIETQLNIENDITKAKEAVATAKEKLKEAVPFQKDSEVQALRDTVQEKQKALRQLQQEAQPEYKRTAGNYLKSYKNAGSAAIVAEREATEAEATASTARAEAVAAEKNNAADAATKKENAATLEKQAVEKRAAATEKRALANDAKAIYKENINPNAEARVNSAKTRITNTKLTGKGLQKDLEAATATYESDMSRLSTQNARLELAKEAGEKGTITRTAFQDKLTGKISSIKAPTADGKISSGTASKIEEFAKEAYEAVKSKLPKDMHSLKKAGWFALGGLGVGVLLKMMAGGSSKPESREG